MRVKEVQFNVSGKCAKCNSCKYGLDNETMLCVQCFARANNSMPFLKAHGEPSRFFVREVKKESAV